MKVNILANYWGNLNTMVKHGVPYDAVNYFSIPNMTSEMARNFCSCGIPLENAVVEAH